MPLVIPSLPVVDEEYMQHVAVFQAVLRARGSFAMAELGARWGTWGARAVAFLRQANPLPYQLYLVDSDHLFCKGFEEVMSTNKIEYESSCAEATPADFAAWADKQVHIDLVDVDIQTAEKDFLTNDVVKKILKEKVYRIILGTHSHAIHATFQEEFSDWLTIVDTPYTSDAHCLMRNLRHPIKENRWIFDNLIREGCYFETSRFGKIAQWDGELILDNPRFVDASRLFSMDDETLRIDELVV